MIGDFDSYTGSTFNALGIDGVGVNSLTLTAVGLPEDDWISLLEVGPVRIGRRVAFSRSVLLFFFGDAMGPRVPKVGSPRLFSR